LTFVSSIDFCTMPHACLGEHQGSTEGRVRSFGDCANSRPSPISRSDLTKNPRNRFRGVIPAKRAQRARAGTQLSARSEGWVPALASLGRDDNREATLINRISYHSCAGYSVRSIWHGHGRACPSHADDEARLCRRIEMRGTGPRMTVEVADTRIDPTGTAFSSRPLRAVWFRAIPQ
jgi:hypothetical protein